MIAALRKRALWRAVGAQLAHAATLLLAVVLWFGGVAAAAVALQAQRDETRSVDLLLVITPAIPSNALIEHSLDLYRRGYGHQVALVGPGRARAQADLLGRGIPPESLSGPIASETPVEAMDAARRAGTQSLLVISAPADQLLSLKIAHDMGMRAYGSPTPGAELAPPDTLLATLSYWRYALLRR